MSVCVTLFHAIVARFSILKRRQFTRLHLVSDACVYYSFGIWFSNIATLNSSASVVRSLAYFANICQFVCHAHWRRGNSTTFHTLMQSYTHTHINTLRSISRILLTRKPLNDTSHPPTVNANVLSNEVLCTQQWFFAHRHTNVALQPPQCCREVSASKR